MCPIIPHDMDGGAYCPAYLDLLIKSLSGRPSVDTVLNPTQNAETFFSQDQPFIDEGLINSRPFNIPRYTYNLDVDVETHLLELQRHRDDFPVVHPSYSVGQTMTDLSTSGGPEGWPGPNDSSEQGDQYAPVDSTFHLPSTPPGAFSAVAQDQGQGTPRERPKQSRKTGKRTTTMPPPASQRQAREARKGRYSCSICDKSYIQKQGLTRHYQEKHEPNVCMICGTFQWGRLYRLKEHHEKEHGDVDLNAALLPAQAPGARRERTITSGYLPRQYAPLPAPGPDKWGPAESPLHPLTPLAKPRPKFPVAISNVGNNPRPAEGRVKFAKDMDVPSRHVQTWFEPEGGRLTEAAARLSTSQSNPVLLPVPMPTPPGSECPVFVLPAFGSPGRKSCRDLRRRLW